MDSKIHLAQENMEYHAELESDSDLEPVKRFKVKRFGFLV